MNISTVNIIFSPSNTNYLKYPKARKILDKVLKNPNVLDNNKSIACKQLNNLLVKNLKNIDKTSKLKVFLLKIRLKFTSIFDCCTKNNVKRKQALAIIASKAKKILKKSEKGSSQTTHHSEEPKKKSEHSKHSIPERHSSATSESENKSEHSAKPSSASSEPQNKSELAKLTSRNSEASGEEHKTNDESSSSSSQQIRRFSEASQDMSISSENHLGKKNKSESSVTEEEIEIGAFAGISFFKTFIEGLKNFEDNIDENGIEAFKYLPKNSHVRLEQSYQHHQICDRLVSITKHLESSSENIKNSWEKYLKKLKENTWLTYPDQTDHKLKTSVVVNLLHNEKPKIHVEKLGKYSTKDLFQIVAVERESFSSHELIQSSQYDNIIHVRSMMKSVENFHFYIARDERRNNKIVGVLQYSPFESLIYSVSRRAMYAQCQVGTLLWEKFSKEVSVLPLTLYARESNPAIRLYESWGFKEVSKAGNFYQQPPETRLRMQKDI